MDWEKQASKTDMVVTSPKPQDYVEERQTPLDGKVTLIMKLDPKTNQIERPVDSPKVVGFALRIYQSRR